MRPLTCAFLAAAFDSENLNYNLNYELPIAILAPLAGVRVIMPDYIGLGTPGPHTYINSYESGNAVLDGARAGLSYAGAPKDAPLGFWGYSQGGGSVAAAAARLKDYAPELNLKGTFSGAPPANLLEVMKGVDGTAIVGVLGMAVSGLYDRNPGLRERFEPEFNERGRQFLESTANMCTTNAAIEWGGRSTASMTVSGKTIGQLIDEDPYLRGIFEQHRIGVGDFGGKLTAPMMVYSSVNDDAVGYEQVRQMAVDFCSDNDDIYFESDDPRPLIPGTAMNHVIPMLTGLRGSFEYLYDRFLDKPAEGNCGEF